MKKNKILRATLFALLTMSLVSCATVKGEKGDQGEQGLPGEKGDKGDPGKDGENGKDGEDGKDGSLWLTGNGFPSSSIGKEGDMYLDTSNGDVYQKTSTGWILKINIKGEDGKDGTNGSSASTYYPTTILPSNYGYVIPSKASAKAGEEITYRIELNRSVNKDAIPLGLKIYENRLNTGTIEFVDSRTQEVTLKMKEGGLVVQPIFSYYYKPITTTIEDLIEKEEEYYNNDNSFDNVNNTYIVEGYIKEFGMYDDFNKPSNSSKIYGNFYLSDEKGNTIHIYGCSFNEHSLYNTLAENGNKYNNRYEYAKDFADENNNPKLTIGDYVKLEVINGRNQEGGVSYEGRILDYRKEDNKVENATLENLHDLKINEPFKIKAKISPYNASYDNLTYEIIDNDKIADLYKVDNYYVINPLKSGSITIKINIDGVSYEQEITIKNETQQNYRLNEVFTNYKQYLNEYIWIDGLYRGNYGDSSDSGIFIGEKDKMIQVYGTNRYLDDDNKELDINAKVSSLGRVAFYHGSLELKDPLNYEIIDENDENAPNFEDVEVLDYSSKDSLRDLYTFDGEYGFREIIVKGYIANLSINQTYGTVSFDIELNKGDAGYSNGQGSVYITTDSRYDSKKLINEVINRGEGSLIKIKGNIEFTFNDGIYFHEADEPSSNSYSGQAFGIINFDIIE